ncbi:MAG: PDZ domain-containing protein [Chloroflexi bacterium]|nr:PDZ domain-containing protein [Chloroflexota bacterium]
MKRLVRTKRLLLVLAALLALSLVGIGVSRGIGVRAQEPTPTPTPEAKPWIGVSIANLDERLAQRLGLSRTSGVVILRVISDSPAAKADLKAKDIILTIDGKEASDVKAVTEAIRGTKVGAEVSLTVMRGDQELTVKVTVGSAPSRPQLAHPRLDVLGRIPFLKELWQGLDPKDIFGHILGGQFRVLDKDGKEVTLKTTFGVVAGVNSDSFTITPNGQTGTVSYKVTANTQFLPLAKGISDLKVGNQVMVVTVGDSNEARVVQLVGLPSLRPKAGGRSGQHRFNPSSSASSAVPTFEAQPLRPSEGPGL